MRHPGEMKITFLLVHNMLGLPFCSTTFNHKTYE